MTPLQVFMLILLSVGLLIFVLTTPAWGWARASPSAPQKMDKTKKEGFKPDISMANTTNTSMVLMDSVIKASFQSAYDGSGVTLDQLRIVIGRGARWLDFDVISVEGQPVVAFTTKPSVPANKNFFGVATMSGDPPNAGSNSLPLTEVLNEVATAAFNKATCPNSADPMFINLRVKTNDINVYATIAAAFKLAFGSALYTTRIAPHVATLSSLAGRVVFVLDTLHSAPGFAVKCDNSYSACAAVQQLQSLAALTCGTASFPLTTATVQQGTSFSPVLPVDPNATNAAALSREMAAAGIRKGGGKAVVTNPMSAKVQRNTSAIRLRCCIPDLAAPANGDTASLIAHWGIQISPQCFWLENAALAAYEELFQDNGGAALLALSAAVGVTTGSALVPEKSAARIEEERIAAEEKALLATDAKAAAEEKDEADKEERERLLQAAKERVEQRAAKLAALNSWKDAKAANAELNAKKLFNMETLPLEEAEPN